ncbi:influenza virus NS1A-binding protein homolog [Tigriopus californicus]|uniref:influenza virus NS1A-binding protein homolog n=1 Tax=Tigriopus californicus TaxID=6832 RepID=UPI0027DA55BC|nr:influenza virus NS1A-binding protein homolog [Tigriopus californicus]
MDILVCYDVSKECLRWVEHTNQWMAFASLKEVHISGSMDVVGGKAMVIGGTYGENRNHGVMEIYDPIGRQWITGPTLLPVRRVHSTVVLNQTALVVIGGYNSNHMIKSVKILDSIAMTWDDLDDLPVAAYNMACGVVNNTTLLCVGGASPGAIVNTAYGLDMDAANPKWTRRAMYDIDEPGLVGFMFHLRDYVYCVTLRTTGFEGLTKLRRMSLTDASPKWEVMEHFSVPRAFVASYVTNGYVIQP